MLLEIDKKVDVDLANNCSVGEQKRDIDVTQYFLLELKEECLLQIEYAPGHENNADIFTKKVSGPTFKRHVQLYCGTDEYGKQGKVLKEMWNLPNPEARESVSKSECSMLWCSMDKSQRDEP